MLSVRRVLFDLDGTLFDTQKYHATIESQLLSEHGIQVSPEEITSVFASAQTKKVFMAYGCDEATALDLARRKWEMIEVLADQALPLADLPALFDALRARGIGFSIGTSSPSSWAKKLLDQHALSHYFSDDEIIGRDKVETGKPHPEVWHKAAAGIDPHECLVVEDGLAGIEAALTAGMRSCLLLPALHPAAQRIQRVDDILAFL